MSNGQIDDVSFRRIDQNTLVPASMCFGGFGFSMWAQLFCGIATCAFPICAWYMEVPSTPVLILILILVSGTLISYRWKILRAATSIAVIMITSYVVADNTKNGLFSPNLWIYTLMWASGGTLLFYGLNKLGELKGSWIEYDRVHGTASVYKSWKSRLLQRKVLIGDSRFSVGSMRVAYGHSGSLTRYYLESTIENRTYNLGTLYQHHSFKTPQVPVGILYEPLVRAVKLFLREWAAGKDHWEPSSLHKAVIITEKPDGYYFKLKPPLED